MKNHLKLLCVFSLITQHSWAQPKQVAITMDDLPFVNEISLQQAQQGTQQLLQHFKKYDMPVLGFVNEHKLIKLNEIDARVALLENWLKTGQQLGNHMFSHPDFNTTPLEDYKTDFLKGEIITQQLNKKYNQTQKYFRFPFLHAGPDSLKKADFAAFLAAQGYENAPVTIDNEDYIFNKVYQAAYKKEDKKAMQMIAAAYLNYVDAMIDYHEELTQQVTGSPIRHIFLCHANQINADYFDKVADLFKAKGYIFITLEAALQDKVYQEPENYIGKGGFSWLHRWRMTKKLPFQGEEPEIPEEIMRLYNN